MGIQKVTADLWFLHPSRGPSRELPVISPDGSFGGAGEGTECCAAEPFDILSAEIAIRVI